MRLLRLPSKAPNNGLKLTSAAWQDRAALAA